MAYSYSNGNLSRRGTAIPVKAILPAIAVLLAGIAVGLANVDALLVFSALIVCVVILLEFRLGVVCLIALMPFSQTTLFPHSIGGITGLNPLNLLLAGTLLSCLLHWRGSDRAIVRAMRPTAWLYVAPFLAAAAIGIQHLGEVPLQFLRISPFAYDSPVNYLQNLVVKPLFIVLYAFLIAAAVARSRRPALFLIPMAVSLWMIGLAAIGYILISGASLGQLAGADSRSFFNPLGYHANELGRLFVIAYALLLYTWGATKDRVAKAALAATLAIVVVVIALTFSRAAFVGFIVVNGLYLLSLRKAVPAMLLSAVALAALAFVMPDAVFERVSSGWNTGNINTISAGRIDTIWLPLLADVAHNPVFGNGLGAIAWSEAMRSGAMLTVGHAHNAFLNTLLEMGIVGLILLCAYFFHVWMGLKRQSQDTTLTAPMRGFYSGAIAALASFLVVNLFGSNLTPCIEQIYLWLAIGMMYGQQRAATKAA